MSRRGDNSMSKSVEEGFALNNDKGNNDNNDNDDSVFTNVDKGKKKNIDEEEEEHQENNDNNDDDNNKVDNVDMLKNKNIPEEEEEQENSDGEHSEFRSGDPSSDSSESPEPPPLKKKRPTYTYFPTAGMTIHDFLLNDENNNTRYYLTNTKDGYSKACVQVGAGTCMHCEHCIQWGVPPTDRTHRTMQIHLTSKDPNIRCPYVGKSKIRKPDILLNVSVDKKMDSNEPLVSEEEAIEFITKFIETNLLAYNKDEINIMIPWIICDFKTLTTFPAKQTRWDVCSETWSNNMLRKHLHMATGTHYLRTEWEELKTKLNLKLGAEFKELFKYHEEHFQNYEIDNDLVSRISQNWQQTVVRLKLPCEKDAFYEHLHTLQQLGALDLEELYDEEKEENEEEKKKRKREKKEKKQPKRSDRIASNRTKLF